MRAEDVTLTLHCDNKCPFCPQPHLEKIYVPRPELDAILQEVRRRGDRIVLTGGEATLYPGFFEVVARCRELGFAQIGIVTNGRRCAKREFARRVLESGITNIVMSIHSYKAEIHDRMSAAEGALEESWRGLANLMVLNARMGFGASIRTNTLLGVHNAAHVPETIRRLARLGVNTFLLMDTLSVDGSDMARYEDVKDAYRSLAGNPDFAGLNVRFRGFPACLFEPLSVSAQGALPLGSSSGCQLTWEPMEVDTTLGVEANKLDVYFQGISRMFTQEPSACAGCGWSSRCNGVQKTYLKVQGDELLGSPQSKRVAAG